MKQIVIRKIKKILAKAVIAYNVFSKVVCWDVNMCKLVGKELHNQF